jgi:transposase
MISCSVGIDVSKATLDVGTWPDQRTFQVENSPSGIADLICWLHASGLRRVLLEASGGYEKQVFDALKTAGFDAICVNPVRARQFALAMGRRAKTDKIDALVLAQFAQKLDAYQSTEHSAERDDLAELVKQRDRFVQQRDDAKRRRHQARSRQVIGNFDRLIAYLDDQIKQLEKDIEQALKGLNSPKTELLRSVKGIGLITAASLMSYLPELGTLSRGQIASLVGLAPFNNDSGTKSGARHIWGGRAKIRRVLYMSVWVVIRYDADFKARYENLRARGKCAKVAVAACMRVLIVRLNAMVRDGTPWITPGVPLRQA